METKPGFDLNTALGAWKQGLAGQPEISSEDARELEVHLLECFDAEQRQGVPAAEAFAAAVKRLGAPDCIGAEFAKLNPLRTWPHRVSLIVLAGVAVWAWSTITSATTLWMGMLGLWNLPTAVVVIPSLVLNGVLPLAILILTARGRAKGLLQPLAWLFSSRLILLAALLVFGLLFNYLIAWGIWNHPNSDMFFGPAGKEKLTLGGLFWQYCAHWPSWPGPIVALLIWLAPFANRTLAAGAMEQEAKPRVARELTFWFVVGLVAMNCFSMLSGGSNMLSSKFAFWLYGDAETPFRILVAVLRWVPTALLCGLAVMTVLGKMHPVAEKLGPWFCGRSRVVAAGIMAVVISYGVAGLSYSMAGASLLMWLLSSALWLGTAIGLAGWLAPSALCVRKNGEGAIWPADPRDA